MWGQAARWGARKSGVSLAASRVRLVVDDGCCDPRLCGQINLFFPYFIFIQNMYVILCNNFPVLMMQKIRFISSNIWALPLEPTHLPRLLSLVVCPWPFQKSMGWRKLIVWKCQPVHSLMDKYNNLGQTGASIAPHMALLHPFCQKKSLPISLGKKSRIPGQ